ncbi:MAG: toprim domain-containing protein, partial [Oscillospiraceae bacterium]|nr:toprim domain-containing protein [Oscillospiraceae bacterium]
MSYYTQQQVQAANNTDLVSFLASHGETTVRKGRDSLWEKHQVWINGHEWFSHYENVGGNAIDFVRRYYGLDFRDAVRELIGTDASECVPVPASLPPPKEKKPLVLPERNSATDRVTAYLTEKRFVSSEIVSVFIDNGTLYESADHHDCVFVGMDEDRNPRHCHKRSTARNFKQTMPGSEAEFSFHYNGADDSLFVFEAPIDLLAYITLHPDGWRNHSYVALCSVADRALTHRLDVNPNLRKVYLCLDNDEAGQMVAERMKDSLTGRGYEVEILLPTNKDWDEDLKAANGVAPIPAGEQNQTTHITESEDYELNENTDNLNANPEAADPIDELMAFAEPMETTMPSATKTEDDLLAERLRKMYAPDVYEFREPAPEVSSETDAPVPVTKEDNTADVSSASPVSGNDESATAVPPQNRLPEVPKAELAQDPNWRKSDPEIDPYVHPYYKYGDMLWYAKPIKDGETLVPLATFTPRLMTENTIHNTSEQKRVYEIGGHDWQGDPLPKLTVPASDLSKTQWVDNLLPSPNHLYVFNGSKEHFAGAIKSTGRFASLCDTYTYTGWEKIGGEWRYLMPGVDGVTGELETGMDSYCLEPGCAESDLRVLTELIDGSAVTHDVLYPCLATAFLSPLNEFLRQAECEPRFLLLMVGESGNLKSSVSALALSFFGKFTDQNLPMNFRDTANSI